jgi:hypothetical protein
VAKGGDPRPERRARVQKRLRLDLEVLADDVHAKREPLRCQLLERAEEDLRLLVELPAVVPEDGDRLPGAVRRDPVALQLVAVDAGVDDRALRPQLVGQPGGPVVGHRLEEARDAAEEFLPVKAGIEDDLVRRESRREVREAEVHVRRLAAGNRVVELVLVEVDDLWDARELRQGADQLGEAEHPACQQHVELPESLADFLQQREVPAAQAPLPEAPRQGQRLHAVPRVRGDPLREEPVRAAAERLDEQDAQAPAPHGHDNHCSSRAATGMSPSGKGGQGGI